MKKVNRLYQLFTLLSKPTVEETAVVPYAPRPLERRQSNPDVIVIPHGIDLPQTINPFQQLADFIRKGSLYHPLCRNAFVKCVQTGYYAYEGRKEWHTCTLAAAYAGAFGPDSIQRPEFSYSMAIWRLSQNLHLAIGTYMVSGPTGREQNLADEMIELTDKNLWTREGVAEWVGSLRSY